MSARDTFEWYVTAQAPGKSPAQERLIRGLREYLFTLRSEDERQRFVEWAMEEIRRSFDSVRATGGQRRPS